MLIGKIRPGNPQLLSDSIIKLEDLGVTAYESMVWQQVARRNFFT